MKTWMVAMIGLVLTPAFSQKIYPNSDNFGVEFDRQAEWYRQCMQVRDLQPPPTAAAVGPCRPDAYYTKLNQASTGQAEWDQVRACAVARNDTAVLSMLYANGFGVQRDTALATKYACSTAAAYSEMEHRVAHLTNLPAGARYDQCDDITSGYMGAICEGIAATRDDRIRKAFFARLRRSLPASQQAPFDALVAANEAFALAREQNEIEHNGTAAPALALAAAEREREWLREHLAAYEKGRFDVPPAEAFPAEDAQLNAAYRQAVDAIVAEEQHPQFPRLGGEVKASGVQTTQRAWLGYRDAWVRFAGARYPNLPADALKAALTQWRVNQLGLW